MSCMYLLVMGIIYVPTFLRHLHTWASNTITIIMMFACKLVTLLFLCHMWNKGYVPVTEMLGFHTVNIFDLGWKFTDYISHIRENHEVYWKCIQIKPVDGADKPWDIWHLVSQPNIELQILMARKKFQVLKEIWWIRVRKSLGRTRKR